MKRFISTTSAVAAVLFFTGISFAQGVPATTQKNVALDVPTIQLNMGVAVNNGANQENAVVTAAPSLDLPTIQTHMGAAPEWSLYRKSQNKTADVTNYKALDLPTIQLQTGR